MGNKLVRSLITPYLWVSMTALSAFAFGLLYLNVYFGIIALAIVAGLGFASSREKNPSAILGLR